MQYDRIAGYFNSSILELAGEIIDDMPGKVRVICNSGLREDDVRTAQLADNAMKLEWNRAKAEELDIPERFKKLYDLLVSKKMEVRVIPNSRFGLIHGKAGIITRNDGS